MAADAALKVVVGQLNPTVGAITRNIDKIYEAWLTAKSQGADLVITPELSVTGYYPKDLINNPDFLDAVEQAVEIIASLTAPEDGQTSGPALIIGAPLRSKEHSGKVTNSALVIKDGKVQFRYDKVYLANYGVFDEKRNFIPGRDDELGLFEINGIRCGLVICEDAWNADYINKYRNRCDVMISINGSPFIAGKQSYRISSVIGARVTSLKVPFIYVNQMSGQDELVYDGRSFALNADGTLAYQAPFLEESLETIELTRPASQTARIPPAVTHRSPEGPEEIWMTLVRGLRDYIRKNGFSGVVLGMSGGIDSAVVAALAADAIGSENVHLIMMPYEYTDPGCIADAAEGARRLGADYKVMPIHEIVTAFHKASEHADGKTVHGIARENLQSRARGMIVMQQSNTYGWLPLSTGNKSEMAVGYCTIYGDMNGGFNPLKDVYKTDVYALARWRNAHVPEQLSPRVMNETYPGLNVIPQSIIDREPSAELAPGQKDSNTLPPYPVLDGILRGLVDERLSMAEVCNRDEQYTPELVARVWHLLNRAEFKRWQACPGIVISPMALRSDDRRYPITNGFGPGQLQKVRNEHHKMARGVRS